MNVITTTVPATIQIRRSHLFGLIASVAAVAVVSTWAIVSDNTPGAEKAPVAVKSGAATLGASVQTRVTPGSPGLTAEQQSVLAQINALTPTQLRSIRWYYTPSSPGLTAEQQSVLAQINALTPAQLRSIRWYYTPSSPGLTAEQQSVLAQINALTPAQLRSIRWYYTPSSSH